MSNPTKPPVEDGEILELPNTPPSVTVSTSSATSSPTPTPDLPAVYCPPLNQLPSIAFHAPVQYPDAAPPFSSDHFPPSIPLPYNDHSSYPPFPQTSHPASFPTPTCEFVNPHQQHTVPDDFSQPHFHGRRNLLSMQQQSSLADSHQRNAAAKFDTQYDKTQYSTDYGEAQRSIVQCPQQISHVQHKPLSTPAFPREWPQPPSTAQQLISEQINLSAPNHNCSNTPSSPNHHTSLQNTTSHFHDAHAMNLVHQDHVTINHVDHTARPISVDEHIDHPPQSNPAHTDDDLLSKPNKRQSLVELRKKVLMSMKEKSRAPLKSYPSDPVQPTTVLAKLDPVVQQPSEHKQQIPTNTRKRRATCLIFDISDNESDDEEHLINLPAEYMVKRQRLSRSEKVEEMKIRMVQLGQCPAALAGKSQPQQPSHQTVTDEHPKSSSKLPGSSRIPILELKERIAFLERIRKQKMEKPANGASVSASENRKPNENTFKTSPGKLAGKKASSSNALHSTRSFDNGKIARSSKKLPTAPKHSASQQPKRRTRYYVETESKHKGKPIASNEEKSEKDISTSPAAEAVQTPWNDRKLDICAAEIHRFADESARIEELMTDLRTAEQQLTMLRDYSKLVHAADVSVAQAAAKLSFKRQRLGWLKKELQEAQLDVYDAEQDFQKIGRAAERIRNSLIDIPNSDDLFPRLDFCISETENTDQTLSATTRDASNSTCDQILNCDVENIQPTVSLLEPNNCDAILQPSPYSPSNGDYFTSCLTGLRSFLLRVPVHTRARDRRNVSPLSLTWTHNIDPMKTICLNELHGQCSDPKCDNEHLRQSQSRKGHALDVIERVQSFFDPCQAQSLEKDIVRSKLSVYSGKNLDVTLSSLISAFESAPGKIPLASRSIRNS